MCSAPFASHSAWEDVFPLSRRHLGDRSWADLMDRFRQNLTLEEFAECLAFGEAVTDASSYLSELAHLEWVRHQLASFDFGQALPAADLAVNPSLEMVPTSWRMSFLSEPEALTAEAVSREDGFALLWKDRASGGVRLIQAGADDLLALKVAVEGHDPREVARLAGVRLGEMLRLLDRAVEKGLLERGPSRLRRVDRTTGASPEVARRFSEAPAFSLQWHVTNLCDLHCKHCYDRTRRATLELGQMVAILDDLYAFCQARNVKGQISFTGGNPFMYPHFPELYREAAERGFALSILGNPVPRSRLEELIAVQPPSYFQVSLEGLPEHNNDIRGSGHFGRIAEFLCLLKDLGIPSQVMLTLTRDNMDQVLPLAECLRGLTDDFTFNRLSPVGEGAQLQLPPREDYMEFLEAYAEAAGNNPILAFKDNLLNVVQHQHGRELFGGCTGFGCGAAFNFVAVLPDGEVHACRKFPSPIGHILEAGLEEIYESEAAQRYRAGCAACEGCLLRPMCGSCLAMAQGLGKDAFAERDPFCSFRG